jgi:hypothetical protein
MAEVKGLGSPERSTKNQAPDGFGSDKAAIDGIIISGGPTGLRLALTHT